MSIRSPTSEEERFRTSAAAFPDTFPVAFSHHEFPSNAAVMNEVGTPFGCIITPFHRMTDGSQMLQEMRRFTEDAGVLARCSTCKGYINPFCNASNVKWICALCGERNSFTRTQGRYRNTDPRLLPELQQVVLDFRVPRNDMKEGKQTRPFVHVIMVQESMPLDSLQAAVDALVQSVDCVHPDVRIALVTFSNRVGVYRLSPRGGRTGSQMRGAKDSMPRQADAFLDVNDSHVLSPPPLQYVHFVCDRVRNKEEAAATKRRSLTATYAPYAANSTFNSDELDAVLGISNNNAASILSGAVGDEEAASDVAGNAWRRDLKQTVIEGRDAALDFAYAAQASRVQPSADGAGSSSYVPGVVRSSEYIRPLLPLGDSVDFWDACARVGQCRASFESAVSALFDACPSVPAAFPGFSGTDSSNAAADHESSDPLNMLGPALEAVLDWLVSRPSDKSESSQAEGNNASAASSNGAMSMLVNLFSGLSGLGTGAGSESDRVRELASGKTGREQDDYSPSSLCSGMMLHVLLASPQDTPSGMHPSVLSTDSGSHSRKRSVLNNDWIDFIARKAADNNICVNVWGIADFASRQLDLMDLSVLAQKTGGKLFRFVLGQRPQGEQKRLALQLARSLSEQYATKCLMKIRTSSLVNMGASDVVGHCYADPELPGVHHVAACAHDNSYSTFLDYHMDSPTTQIEHLVVQVAFSYETLVETEEDLPAEELAAEHRERQLRKDHAMKNPSLISNLYSASAEESDHSASEFSNRRYTSMPKNLLHPEQGVLQLAKDAGAHKMIDAQDSSNGINQAESNYLRFGEECWHLETDAKYWSQRKSDIEKLSNKPKLRVANAARNAAGLVVFDAVAASKRRVYDHSKRLVAVRRLRLITVALECTAKVPRLIKNSHVQTIAVLVAREVFSSRRDGDSPVILIGGLFDWARALAEHVVRLFARQLADQKRDTILSATAVGSTSALKRERRRDVNPDDVQLTPQEYEAIVAEAVDIALKDTEVQNAINILFGAMSRIIATFDKRNPRHVQKQHLRVDNGSGASPTVPVPNRGRAGGLVHSRGPTAASDDKQHLSIAACIRNYFDYLDGKMPLAAGIGFLDGFAEVSTTLLTQDHIYAERYCSPQLYPIHGTSPLLGPHGGSGGSGPSDLRVDTAPIASNRSGITWSMMSSGSQLFLLDAGDEVVLYRNAGTPSNAPAAPQGEEDASDYPATKRVEEGNQEDAAALGSGPQQLVGNQLWLLNDLRRRVMVSAAAPRLYFAQAGTASSGYFHAHLMEQSHADENSVAVVTEEVRACILAGLMRQGPSWLSGTH